MPRGHGIAFISRGLYGWKVGTREKLSFDGRSMGLATRARCYIYKLDEVSSNGTASLSVLAESISTTPMFH